MKRGLLFVLAAVAALGVAAPATAHLCTIEAEPAATLLLPYFEVDIDDVGGIDTFFSINNAADFSVMTHVILWTDQSVEALDFNVYLTGYDVQTISLGLIIRDGVLPITGDANQYSNVGAFSDPHPGSQNAIDYPGCLAIDFPYSTPQLDEVFLEEHLQPLLTGGPSSIYSGRCGGFDHGDNIARGYVTVDVTQDCTLLRPCDVGYFFNLGLVEAIKARGTCKDAPQGPPNCEIEDLIDAFGDNIATYQNVLWGDWYMVDFSQNFAQGDTLVHIEARDPEDIEDALPPVAFLFDDDEGLQVGTFYDRCLAPVLLEVFQTSLSDLVPAQRGGEIVPNVPATIGFTDLREPLPSTFATRFYQNDAFSGGTDLLVWRNSNVNAFLGEEDGFDCDDGPSWFLNERQVVIFDEEENPELPDPCPVSPCPDPEENTLFPLEAQRFSVGEAGFSPDSGWLFLNLNQTREFYIAYETYVYDPDFAVMTQNWVQAVHSADGRFSVGLSAIQLADVCLVEDITLGIDNDDFDYPLDINPYNSYSYYVVYDTPLVIPGSFQPVSYYYY